MKKEILKIDFKNQNNPKSFFDIVKIEELLERDLDHNISKNHLVKFYIIFFVYKGQGYHTIDFTDYKYAEGTVLLIRKDQIHKFSRSTNLKGYLLVFTEEFINGHLNRKEVLKSMQLFNNSLSFPKIKFNNKKELSDFTSVIKQLDAEYQSKDDFSIGITRSLLHVIITKLFRIKSRVGHSVKGSKYMSQFLEFQSLVDRDCFKSKKVQYYSKLMGVSTKTLNNIVNDVVNNSTKAFIDEISMLRIKALLISTDYSIKEISYISGFNDPTNFYKYFKKFTGSSPEVFRKAH